MAPRIAKHNIDPPSSHLKEYSNGIDPIADQQVRMTDPPSSCQNCTSVRDKKVRFSGKDEILPCDSKGDVIHRLWHSRRDIEAFIIQRRQVINHVQNMSKSIADTIDASEYMVSGSLQRRKRI